MILYLFLYFILLIGAYVSKRSPFVLYFMFAVMALMVGLRGETVGTDTEEYMSLYASLRYGYKEYPEPIYGLLGEWGNVLGMSFQVFHTILTFIALCFTAFVVRRQSPNYCLSLLLLITLFFFFYSLNIYREMIACYISIPACYILYEERYRWRKFKFCSLILLAAGFHISSFILLSLLLVRKIKLRGWLIVGGILISLMIGVLDLANIFAPILGWYEKYLDRYARTGDRYLLGLALAMYWIFAFLYLYKKSDEDFRESYYMKMFFCGILASNVFLRQDMGLRIMLYFTIPLIIGLPRFIRESRNSLLNQAIVIGYSSIYFFAFLYVNSADVVPYTIY